MRSKGTNYLELEMICPGRVSLGVYMKDLTTFRIGGPADALVGPTSTAEIVEVVAWAHRNEVPLLVVGRGSNLLVQDKGIRGVVMQVGPPMDQWEVEDLGGEVRLRAQSGLPLRRLLREGLKRGWGGMEFLVGIPGFLGGAMASNAGTPEGCIGDILVEMTWVSPNGEIRTQRRQELTFSYRKLEIPHGSVIVEAGLRLRREATTEIREGLRRRMLNRRRRQPLGIPSAGSVFKNPPGAFAGRIVDGLGLKGMTCGGAQVSMKHANFIVNTGKARARDVLRLINEIRRRVLKETGIELELEVQVVGEAP
jgi:UDP-N-acetylmuramate dehydrogenase